MPEISCSTCSFFQPPRQPPAGFDMSNDISGVHTKGVCHRFPQTVGKAPTDNCGEHPEASGRHKNFELMERIAVLLDKLANPLLPAPTAKKR